MIDVSFVVVSFNTRYLTAQCVRALIEHTTGISSEIIVVDNASHDGSADYIAEHFPEVILVRNERNVGFGAGQNIGMQRSRGRHVAAVNSDCVFTGDVFKTLVEFLDANQDVGAIGPRILNPDGSVAPSARRAVLSRNLVLLGIVNRHFRFKRFLPERAMRRFAGVVLGRWHDNYAPHDALIDADLVDGMCVVFRRTALERVGLFDEQFFFDLEINDLSNRIRAAGWRIVFNPAVSVTHLAHSSRKHVSRIVVETHRSELVYFSKYAPHYVPAIRRTVRVVVGTRLALARLLGVRGESIEIYREILALNATFDATGVRANERIPSLGARQA